MCGVHEIKERECDVCATMVADLLLVVGCSCPCFCQHNIIREVEYMYIKIVYMRDGVCSCDAVVLLRCMFDVLFYFVVFAIHMCLVSQRVYIFAAINVKVEYQNNYLKPIFMHCAHTKFIHVDGAVCVDSLLLPPRTTTSDNNKTPGTKRHIYETQAFLSGVHNFELTQNTRTNDEKKWKFAILLWPHGSARSSQPTIHLCHDSQNIFMYKKWQKIEIFISFVTTKTKE